MRGSLKRKLTALCVSSVLTLLVAELLARYAAHRNNARTMSVALEQDHELDPTQRIGLIDIIRMSPNDKIAYELKPDLSGIRFKGGALTTNAAGFRGVPIPAASARTVTIVGIGDSIMFGHGVSDDETFLYALDRSLRRAHPEVNWRIVNTGVPGYNTVMEVETLRTKALEYEPDVVLLSLVPNDLALPIYISEVQDVTDLSRSFFLEFLLSFQQSEQDAAGMTARIGRDPRLARAPELDVASTVPPRYRHLAGWDAFVGAIDALEELSQEHGFEVVTCSTVETPLLLEFVEETRARGWTHVPLMAEIDTWMQNNLGVGFDLDDPDTYGRSALAVSVQNPHPSALQHEMMCNKILIELQRSGTLERLLSAH